MFIQSSFIHSFGQHGNKVNETLVSCAVTAQRKGQFHNHHRAAQGQRRKEKVLWEWGLEGLT